MDLGELKSKLEKDLQQQLVSSRALLGSLRLISEQSRHSSAFTDPIYYPFYYYLAKYVKPTNFVDVGFGLGLSTSAFFQNNTSVEMFLALQRMTNEYYSPRLAHKNILQSGYNNKAHFYHGDFSGFADCVALAEWDLALFDTEMTYDDYRRYLDILWEQMAEDGLILMERLNDKTTRTAFTDFCQVHNRSFVDVPTKYTVGIVAK